MCIRDSPSAGRALGTFVGGPVSGMIGGKLASAAGRMFGLELEGLSVEDREFEVARRLVRFASATTKNALSAPPTARGLFSNGAILVVFKLIV